MIEEIAKIIKEKDFSRLIGLKENLWFEAKGKEPYQLDLPGGRYELAKDVSAFANSEGGHIVIGLTHKRLENEMAEEIIGLELILKAEFDIDKYKGLIKHYIYPEIDNISITWQESTNEKDKGVGHIFIPLQKESKKYFLITKGIIVEGEELKDNVVGLARRVGSSNMPISGKEIYNIMQKGKSDFAQRLSGIENMLAVIDKNMSIMLHEINILQKPAQTVKQISFEKLYDAIKKATE
jgi:predicted HTH transcriptional regulator